MIYFPDEASGDVIEEKIFKGALGRIMQDALDYIKNHYIKETVIKHLTKQRHSGFGIIRF